MNLFSPCEECLAAQFQHLVTLVYRWEFAFASGEAPQKIAKTFRCFRSSNDAIEVRITLMFEPKFENLWLKSIQVPSISDL